MSLATPPYLRRIPVRSLQYRTDVADIAIPQGDTEFILDVRGHYGGIASAITFLNRSDNVVTFQAHPSSPGFGIPAQTQWTRVDAWMDWFRLAAPEGFGADSDLAITIAPISEVETA